MHTFTEHYRQARAWKSARPSISWICEVPAKGPVLTQPIVRQLILSSREPGPDTQHQAWKTAIPWGPIFVNALREIYVFREDGQSIASIWHEDGNETNQGHDRVGMEIPSQLLGPLAETRNNGLNMSASNVGVQDKNRVMPQRHHKSEWPMIQALSRIRLGEQEHCAAHNNHTSDTLI